MAYDATCGNMPKIYGQRHRRRHTRHSVQAHSFRPLCRAVAQLLPLLLMQFLLPALIPSTYAFSDLNATTSAIKAALSTTNTVGDGLVSFFFVSDCIKYNLSSCFALNKDSPYGMVHLPEAPGQTLFTGCLKGWGGVDVCGNGCVSDASAQASVGDQVTLTKGVCKNNMPMKWRLENSEAVVVIGTTPPDMRYWSVTPYLFSAYYENTPNINGSTASFSSPFQKAGVSCSPSQGPARCQYFSSLGDPFNYNSFNNTPAAPSGLPGMSQDFAMVMTGSAQTYAAVAAAITSETGLPTVHLLKIPTDIAEMSVTTNTAAQWSVLMRVAYPSNQTDFDAYTNDASTPMRVLRVTPNAPPVTTSSLYTQASISYVDRATAPEHVIGPPTTLSNEQLAEAVVNLGDAIISTHTAAHPTSLVAAGANTVSVGRTQPYVFSLLAPFFVEGYDCVKDGTMCNADCPDTLYPISSNIYDAVGCQTIPVWGLGVIVGLILGTVGFFIFLAPSGCNICKGSCARPGPTLQTVESASVSSTTTTTTVTKGVGASRTWCWSCLCPSLPGNTYGWWFVALVSFLIPFGLALGITSAIWEGPCQGGHAATLDSTPEEFYVVYGVNHEAVNFTTYSSVNVYAYDDLMGVAAASSTPGGGYDGSAQLYLGSDSSVAPYLFAMRFARNCTRALGTTANCLDIAFPDSPGSDGVGIAKDRFLLFITRMYVSTATGRGPLSNFTVMSKGLHFL